MACYPSAAALPVLTTLAREFAVCDRWYSSMPGPTWPNRFFVNAASSGGLDHSPTLEEVTGAFTLHRYRFQHGTIFDRLSHAGLPWRIYAGDDFPVSFAMEGMMPWYWLDGHIVKYEHFTAQVAEATYVPVYTFIEPSYGRWWSDYRCGTSQHPLDDVTRGEHLIKWTYEALRRSPLWDTSVLIVTWDEHGGFYDHARPPRAVPPGDETTDSHNNQYGFPFDQYGVRVPGVVVSPLVPRNLVDHRVHDHASVPATVETILGLAPLTRRDAAATPLTTLLSLDRPRTDTPAELPDPAPSGIGGCPALPPGGAGPTAPAADGPAGTATGGQLTGSAPGFLHLSLLRDLSVTPATETASRVARWQEVRTHEHAWTYVQEVLDRLRRSEAPRPR